MTGFIIQIVFGSLFLLLSAMIHVALFAKSIPLIITLSKAIETLGQATRNAILISAGLGLLITAHTATIWLWAFVFYISGAVPEFSNSFYFAAVTYTTLGYGDIVLGPLMRIFASFAAITGLLTFGLSTAFLVGFLVRILPDVFRQE